MSWLQLGPKSDDRPSIDANRRLPESPIFRCGCALFALIMVTAAASAQNFGHVDAEFEYADGKVQLSQPVYTHVFPTSGISQQYTSNPGFGSETDVGGGIGPHETIFYHVLDPLFFWDGTAFTDPAEDTQIRILNNPPTIPQTVVGVYTGPQEGSLDPPLNLIGKSMASGDFHSHVSFQLEPQSADSPPPPAFGAYGLKLSVGTSAEGIDPSDPIFFVFKFGLDEAAFQQGVEAFAQLLQADYNENGQLDAADLDLQAVAITEGNHPPTFDLNNDQLVTFEDRLVWVNDLKQTWIGDANLDEEFNSGDLVQVFVAGKYESSRNALWEEGDWDGDTRFDSGDMVAAFVAGGYEVGARPLATAQAVPEPASLTWLVPTLLVLAGRCRRKRT